MFKEVIETSHLLPRRPQEASLLGLLRSGSPGGLTFAHYTFLHTPLVSFGCSRSSLFLHPPKSLPLMFATVVPT
jgi:hypothetical protein